MCIQHNFVWRLIIYTYQIVFRHTQTHCVWVCVVQCIHMSVRAQAHVSATASTNVRIHGRERDVCVCVRGAPSRFFIYAEACEPLGVHVCVSLLSMCVFIFALVSSAGIQFALLSTYNFDKNSVCTICRIAEEKSTNWREEKRKEDLFNTHNERPTQTHPNEWKRWLLLLLFHCLFRLRCHRLLTIFN